MQAGRMRRVIQILSPTYAAQNSYGEKVIAAWAVPSSLSGLTLWGDMRPMTAKEVEFSKSFAALSTAVIETRYIPSTDPTANAILPSWRVQYGDRVYAINGVINTEEKNRTFRLFVTEIVQ